MAQGSAHPHTSSVSHIPPPRRRRRIVLFAVLIAVGTQVPLIAALANVTGRLVPVLGLAALLTAGFVTGLTGPRSVWGEPNRARLYLIIWPFFVWWTMALVFAL